MLGPCYQYLSLPLYPCFILIPTLCSTQGHYVYSIYPDIIFQTLPSCSRLVMSHHVTCHVTSLSCASSLFFKKKKKQKKKKSKIEKEKKRKVKLLMSKVSHNNIIPYIVIFLWML